MDPGLSGVVLSKLQSKSRSWLNEVNSIFKLSLESVEKIQCSNMMDMDKVGWTEKQQIGMSVQ